MNTHMKHFKKMVIFYNILFNKNQNMNHVYKYFQFGMVVIIGMMVLSCSYNNDEYMGLKKSNSTICIERYIPVGTPHLVTLKNGLQVYVDQDSVYYLGDITFSKELIDSIGNEPIKDTRSAVIKNYILYWPNCKVPYEISSNFSSSQIENIEYALKIISEYSSLEFVKASSKDFHKIYIYKDGKAGMSSDRIGMNPDGINKIHLDDSFNYGNVMHEIMHCLGFFHEQKRSDRDEHIKILWDNIIDDYKYEQYKTYTDGYDVGSFDKESIMMYSSFDFTKNGEPTCLTINNDIVTSQRTQLSNGDIQGLNFLYGPKIILRSERLDDEGHSSSDPGNRDDNYSNSLYLISKTGEPVTLKNPRLAVVKYSRTYQGSNAERAEAYEEIKYIIIPSGVSSYGLSNTYDYISSGQEGIEYMDATGYTLIN